MQNRTLKTLEYDKIIDQLVMRANCCVSRELANALTPEFDFSKALFELELTLEAETLFRRTGYTPVDDFPDMRNTLKRLHAVLFLPPGELLNISKDLRAIRTARESLVKENTGAKLLNLAHSLITNEYIESEINRCILNEDELFDNASPALARIRKSIRQVNEKVREKLNTMIRSSTYQKYLQEPIITMRNGRFVIPVKHEYRTNIPGLIHDQSGSGQTLFIEPTIAVELGNELKRLQAEESAEVERILTELTAMVTPAAKDIYDGLLVLGDIDLVFAKAKLAAEMNAICPKLNDKGIITIVRGAHPLIPRDKVVPIDIWLGDNFKTLIITGPNTGGKTVTLKTVGLFTLMAMSGMFVPAAEGTELSVFDNVFADIGDEQSIEQSLSTFSSHMKNIVDILNNATESSMVLLDELGAGTDPVEGAALAMSILETLHASNCDTLATTHYSEIKAFALSREGMENASMEFDINRLCPTYRLFVGIPGKSNAFEISKRLGLSDTVINRAKSFLKKEDVSFEDIISSADETRKIAERERALATAAREELYNLREQVERERLKLEEERQKNRRKAKEETKAIIANTKREMESLIKSLRELKNIDKSELDRTVQKTRDRIRDTERQLSDTSDDTTTKPDEGEPPKSVSPGQTVRVLSIDKEATVLSPADTRGDVMVQVGIMKLTVKLADLRPIAHSAKSAPGKNTTPKSKTVSLELDIRGLMVDEALPIVDSYIDDAYMAGLNEVNIIHGKGTGALRTGVQGYLRKHPRVANFRMGDYGQGDAGVTVVALKKN